MYIETYGCALNRADTRLMYTVLSRNGFQVVDSPSSAEVIIINTCTVRQDTEERMKQRILELSRSTSKRGSLLVVAGCMATAQPFTVKSLAPGSVIVSTYNVHYIHRAIIEKKDLLSRPRMPKYVVEKDVEVVGEYSAEVAIQDGCLGDCSFCITKYARRSLLSRRIEHVVEIVEKLVRRGVVEVKLAGQDTAAYGVDIYGKRMLPVLMEKLSRIKGDFMIRVGMTNPDQLLHILDEFVEQLRKPRFFKFVHIPVQSGDDNVLKLMKRNYTVDEFRNLVKEIRRKVPGVTIATDIIVGHPGEDEEAFENTVRLVEELRFERVHVAQYTPRPRTLSAGLPQVPSSVKKERSKKLTELIERIGLEENSTLVGSRVEALVVSAGERGGLDAKMFNYTPVVVGSGEARIGEWKNIEIIEATWYDLRGKVVEEQSG